MMSDKRNITIASSLTAERNSMRVTGRVPRALRLSKPSPSGPVEKLIRIRVLAPAPSPFEHGPASEPIHQFRYAREKNPTQLRLEAALRDLEGRLAALVFSSGMVAAAAMLQTLKPGSHVIFSKYN